MSKYFYDSYAIIEFINGNPKYKKYFIEHEGITTLYNVMEVYYSILKENKTIIAKKVLEFLKPILIYPTIEDIKEAMEFRFKHKEKRLSYADCLGYTISFKNKIRFLTGDQGFKNLPNIEYPK